MPLAVLLLALAQAGLARAQNLLVNGDFEARPVRAAPAAAPSSASTPASSSSGAATASAPDPADATLEPRGWHTRITSFTPIPEYRDPAKKQGRTGNFQFKCGCGRDWGSVRPWALLVCPGCKHAVTGLEDSGDWYQRNHECVSVGPSGGRPGQALRFTLPEAVGNNQGVRALSDPVRVRRGEGFEVSFDARAGASHCRVFVEGFRLEESDKVAQEWVKTLPAEANPLKQTTRLRRVFRQQVNAQTPGKWTPFKEQFVSEGRYAFDVLIVNLYAYMPGEVAYDNVVLRRLSPAEMAQYRRENPPPEDERLR